MTTKPPSKIKPAEASESVKKIYEMVESLKDIIPFPNDRYRLGFCLNRYFDGEASTIKEAVFSAKPESCTVSISELEKLVEEKYSKLGL